MLLFHIIGNIPNLMTVTRCVVGVVKNQVSVDVRRRMFIWNTILDFVQNLRVDADKFLCRVFGITMGSTRSRTLANVPYSTIAMLVRSVNVSGMFEN